MTEEKEYIGDSVYAKKIEGYGLYLTTENGIPTDPSNEIFLDDITLNTLLKFIEIKYNMRVVKK